MTGEQFEALVRRLEAQAREDPKGYGRKVVALASLGYAFIALALLVLLGLGALVVYLAITASGVLLKLLFPIGAFAWVVLRSLSVKLDPPEGIPLRRDDAPELFRMIDEVNERVQGPKVHQVLINGDLNAAVVQIPRRGGIFGQRNYLLLGLPYMQALSPEEFRAVVAHELGHLSKAHGRFGTWIYRIRMTWWQLLQALEAERRLGSGIFRRFFGWYAPYFNAYTFPLMRAHEFEADDAAASAAGPLPAMTALASAAVADGYLAREYWPKVYKRADEEREPPRSAFAPLRQELVGAKRHADAEKWLQAELARPAAVDDTHPSLVDRIQHLGLTPDDVLRSASSNGASAGETAARAYLGDAETTFVEALDRDWREAIAPQWRERHAEAQEERRLLEELEARAEAEQLGLDDARTLAGLSYDYRDEDVALRRYRDVLELAPADAPAHFAVGQILLSRGDDSGLHHLEQAIENDPEAVVPACKSAFFYLLERGREEEAERYRERAEAHLDKIDAAAEERETVTVEDEFVPHDLAPDLVEQLRRPLETYEEIGAAYLVKKQVEHLGEEYPLYVLGVVPRSRWRQTWRDADDDTPSLVQRLAEEIESPVELKIVVHHIGSKLKDRIAAVPGAEIFSRD